MARDYPHATAEELTVIQDNGIEPFPAVPIIEVLLRAFCTGDGASDDSVACGARKILRHAVVDAGILA